MDASKRIDKEIAGLDDWRGEKLAEIRKAIHEADKDVIEEWKWMGTACWNHDGLVCGADAHTKVVKVIFFKGASLPDPDGLFNGELEGNVRRAIKFFEGDRMKGPAFKKLVRAAVALNASKAKGKAPSRAKKRDAPRSAAKRRRA